MTATRSPLRVTSSAAAFLLLLGGIAQAHPGHGPGDFTSGLMHPLQGWDHLLAMLAIGLWAVQLGGRALWLVPTTFVSLAAMGAGLGASGVALPGVEQGIVASVFVLGLLLMLAYRLPLAASVALTSVFALCHGFAHGAEMPAGATAMTFGFGFILSTIGLHAWGMIAGFALRAGAQPRWLQAAGAAVVVVGAVAALS